MKIALIYAYNGAGFSGSQIQPHKNTVENAINEALCKIGIFEPVVSSSRTDKSVHALMQVSCTHCDEFWSEQKLKEQISRHLPSKIALKAVRIVNESFHPRFSAKARTYRYVLAHGYKNAFLADFVYYCKQVDNQKLKQALKLFCGTHDFSGFYKLGSNEKSSIRCVYFASSHPFKTNLGNFTIINLKANGFLRSQVRLLLANAIKASSDESAMDALKDRFLNKNLNAKIPTKIPISAQGLYLKKIFYLEFI